MKLVPEPLVRRMFRLVHQIRVELKLEPDLATDPFGVLPLMSRLAWRLEDRSVQWQSSSGDQTTQLMDRSKGSSRTAPCFHLGFGRHGWDLFSRLVGIHSGFVPRIQVKG
jgi:hypothetical protein